MCTHILNFNRFNSSQLCKLYLIYIATCMCCNHCNIWVMTYLKAKVRGMYWHILWRYTIWGVTKFGKFSKFNTVDTKISKRNFRDFLMNWIYLSETFLGPTGHFFDSQKCQKRIERFWFGVNFTHFCFPVFYVTLFLENHSIFSHEILYSYIILV